MFPTDQVSTRYTPLIVGLNTHSLVRWAEEEALGQFPRERRRTLGVVNRYLRVRRDGARVSEGGVPYGVNAVGGCRGIDGALSRSRDFMPPIWG